MKIFLPQAAEFSALSRPAAIFRIANQMQPKSLPPLRLRNMPFLFVLTFDRFDHFDPSEQ